VTTTYILWSIYHLTYYGPTTLPLPVSGAFQKGIPTSDMSPKIAVIFGAGPGLAAGLARALAPTHSLMLLSRSLPGSLPKLELGDIPASHILAVTSDGSKKTLDAAFEEMEKKWPEGVVEVGIFNAGGRYSPGKFLERKEEDFRANMESFAISAFTFGQAIVPHLLKTAKTVLPQPPSADRTNPTLIFTGATMSMRSGANFSAMAPGMFARRAISQSLAREFGPQGVHVAHVIVDGMIETPQVREGMGEDKEEKRLHVEDMAETYLALIKQPRSAWTQELDMRPFKETF